MIPIVEFHGLIMDSFWTRGSTRAQDVQDTPCGPSTLVLGLTMDWPWADHAAGCRPCYQRRAIWSPSASCWWRVPCPSCCLAVLLQKFEVRVTVKTVKTVILIYFDIVWYILTVSQSLLRRIDDTRRVFVCHLGKRLGFIEVLEPWMLPASLGPVASVLNSERRMPSVSWLRRCRRVSEMMWRRKTAFANLPCRFAKQHINLWKPMLQVSWTKMNSFSTRF